MRTENKDNIGDNDEVARTGQGTRCERYRQLSREEIIHSTARNYTEKNGYRCLQDPKFGRNNA